MAFDTLAGARATIVWVLVDDEMRKLDLNNVESQLAAQAESADESVDWPSEAWAALRSAGVLAWSLPAACGGVGLPAAELLVGYERLASACLTTTFILSQREAAVRRLASSANAGLQQLLLPRLARDDMFMTVGLSQLTTSRQMHGNSLVAEQAGNGFRLNGVIPWVTGADRAEYIIAGARLLDDRQLLFALPTGQAGVKVGASMDLAALRGSRTCAVTCDGVTVTPDVILGGPAGQVLAGPGGGGAETSALALGLAGSAIDWISSEAMGRPELQVIVDRFNAHRAAEKTRLLGLTRAGPTDDAVLAARVGCTRLALNATQVALTLAKGTGFVRPHPAQRWARQALFFLVWSCPRPVTEGLLAELVPQAS